MTSTSPAERSIAARTSPQIARDIMTRDVVALHPDTPVRQIARILLDNHISAAPVIDEAGRPIGIVSEGDLVARTEGEREARRDWWMSLLAEGEHLAEDFVAYTRADSRTARQIMSAPVVTVSEDATLGEIAQILSSYRIKRVPVLTHRRMVGVVSRADLIRAMNDAAPAALRPTAQKAGISDMPPAVPAAPAIAAEEGLSASHFRHLIANHDVAEAHRRAMQHQIEMEQRHKDVSALISHHVADARWQTILHDAARAASNGEKDFLLLRFPSDLCRDGGRAINAPDDDWPASLRGEAAELYLRWERDLQPRGFQITARVLEFPNGQPGDIGLFLVWASSN